MAVSVARIKHQISSTKLSQLDSSKNTEPADPGYLSLLELEWLVISPYTGKLHQLNLQSVDWQSRALALALTTLQIATDDYATTPYDAAFNWTEVMSQLRSLAVSHGLMWKRQEFYVVDFRSKLLLNIDHDLLFTLDRESHREAMESGGLLMYWYGKPDAARRNLATCIWRSKDDAVRGGRGPWHKQARGIVPKMYQDIGITGMRLIIDDDVDNWQFETYEQHLRRGVDHSR